MAVVHPAGRRTTHTSLPRRQVTKDPEGKEEGKTQEEEAIVGSARRTAFQGGWLIDGGVLCSDLFSSLFPSCPSFSFFLLFFSLLPSFIFLFPVPFAVFLLPHGVFVAGRTGYREPYNRRRR